MQIGDIASDLQVSLAGLDPERIAAGELEGLRHLAFPDCRPEVTIHYAETHKKIRDDADASYFDPQKCEVVIRFVPGGEGQRSQRRASARPPADHGPPSGPGGGYGASRGRPRPQGYAREDRHSPMSAPPMREERIDYEEALTQMLDALQRAEQERRFVGIKWFRDRYLPEQNFSWSQDSRTCGAMLRIGTEDELVVTHKVTNPKNPEHPVTAIRVNRNHPRFRDAPPAPAQPRFQPVRIRGDGLSSTVVEQRR